ncbi:hypothetical protein Atep_22370 [Allochromatium tepidum]|uniref:Homocitrate synthase n=1 Tax=Allochromatium tepidum TaxID=553982 RepID=A0ABN6GC89_9GAMM|nr:hypothetical protein Atep_22370 [Allochromatium tepidum]
MDPFGLYERLHALRVRVDLEIEMHAHDDLGLATANTLAAVRAGATHVNTRVHGLGERAGNAALEEVVMGLKHVQGLDCGVDLKRFSALSTLVAQASGKPIAWHKSLVGAGAFTHEAGIHVDGLIKDPLNYQGVDPAELGLNHRLVLGKHSGRHAVQRVYAESLCFELDSEQAERLLPLVRRFVTETKRSPETPIRRTSADSRAVIPNARRRWRTGVSAPCPVDGSILNSMPCSLRSTPVRSAVCWSPRSASIYSGASASNRRARSTSIRPVSKSAPGSKPSAGTTAKKPGSHG